MIRPGRLLLSCKLYLAAMLALYVAFSRSFDYPYWTMMTVYILALDSSGAMRQKWMFMLTGSVCGAMIGMLVAFEMATSQVAMLLTLFAAMGLAAFFALRDRLPSFYGFMIGGVTCLLVALPGLTTPDAVLFRAIDRIQDIVVGACCLFLVDTLIFPTSGARGVGEAVAGWLTSLRTVTVAVLRGLPPDDQAFAAVLGKIAQIDPLASYLPFDSISFGARRRRAAEIIRTRGVRTLSVLSTVRDIDAHLREGRLGVAGPTAPLDMANRQALADWIEGGAARAQARTVYRRLRTTEGRVEPATAGAAELPQSAQSAQSEQAGWLRTLRRLQHRQLRHLFAAWWLIGVAHRSLLARRPLRLRVPEGFTATPGTLAPLDVGYTLRVVAGLLCHFGTFAFLWLTFGWVSGYAAFGMLLSSVFFVVSGRAPNPVAVILKVSQIVAIAMVIVGIYVCAVLPWTSAFPTVAIVLFPALLVLGIFVPNPPNVLFAVLPMAMLRLGNNGPSVNLPALLNSVMGLAIGLCTALFWIVLLVRLPAGGVARRLIREGWLDLLDLLKALNRPRSDVSRDEARSYGWRMLDRLVVLFQQFAGGDPGRQRLIVVDTLRQVRAGQAAFVAGLGPLAHPAYGVQGKALTDAATRDALAGAARRPLWHPLRGVHGVDGTTRAAEQANASATERAAAWLTATQPGRTFDVPNAGTPRAYDWIDVRLGRNGDAARRYGNTPAAAPHVERVAGTPSDTDSAADTDTGADTDTDTDTGADIGAWPDAVDCALADLRLALYPEAMAPGVTPVGDGR